MDIENLKSFINLEDKRLKEKFNKIISTDKETILARTVKLSEEVGELCNEILIFNGYQRKEKLVNHDKNNLQNEFADVILTTLILAKSMGIDIEKALTNKIKEVNKRYC